MSHALDKVDTVRTDEGDVEIGATDAIEKHFSRHVVQRKKVSDRKLNFEHKRPRILRECMAEATGVFFYVYPGIASVATFTLAVNNPETAAIAPALGSIFQIGLAFAIGIAFAIITCAPTSGGHFNPAITLCFAFWQGFPWKKVPHYILSQILGSFMAAMLLYGQYHQQISAYSAELIAKGEPLVSSTGPAGIFMTLPQSYQTNLGYLFFIEFFVDSYIAIVIWACLDPANPFVSPTQIPFTIGLAYATMIWGFAGISISTNLARDLGCRMVAAIFFGGEVFSYHNYSWISILVNVPATLLATGYYEFLMRDSLQKLGKGVAVYEGDDEGLRKHMTRTGIMSSADNMDNPVKRRPNGNSESSTD